MRTGEWTAESPRPRVNPARRRQSTRPPAAGRIRTLLVRALHALDHPAVRRALGRWNRRRPFLDTLFVLYAADERFSRAYPPLAGRPERPWSPRTIGLFEQAGRWGLVLGVPNTEGDLRAASSRPDLVSLFERVHAVREDLGAVEVCWAGALPEILRAHRITLESQEAGNTVRLVHRAERVVRSRCRLDPAAPLVLVGGKRAVKYRLQRALGGRPIVYLDPGDAVRATSWPDSPALILNLAPGPALRSLVPHIRAGHVILNTAYPDPPSDVVRRLTARGCRLFHLAGVRGRAWPSFPGPYAGAVPCCAAIRPSEAEVVLRRMT